MNILVLNCGSSSLKFQIIETDLSMIETSSDKQLARGLVERIGSHSLLTFHTAEGGKVKRAQPLRDHREAVDAVLRWLVEPETRIEQIKSLADIHAVGHRIVHGGEKFKMSVRIDKEILTGIEDCIELAPLHNPSNIKGIQAISALLGDGVPQVAVFDTSFHSTLPETAYLYGIPYQFYRRYKIRRYGFHGTSHRYIAYHYRRKLNLQKEDVNIISLHLGNGCSACAIKHGDSVDTSMGFTPLEGLIMGTRAGSIDFSVAEYLSHKEGMTFTQIDTLLNKQSGLLGLSGLTSDMRELLEECDENQDRRAKLAIDIFCNRVVKYVGAYFVEMGGTDAVVFTGGIGENSAVIREQICNGLTAIGLELDVERNSQAGGDISKISTDDSKLHAYVMPTNEELLIARDTFRVVENVPRRW